MDAGVIAMLEQVGVPTDGSALPQIAIRLHPDGRVLPILEDVPVITSREPHLAMLGMKRIRELFAGNRRPPPAINPNPDSPYVFLMAQVETTALRYCDISGDEVTDRQFERLYQQLRRRPDGREKHLLHGYLRAAVRLHLSMVDLSQAEFKAVMKRLSRSARTFTLHATSRNYLAQLRHQFQGGPAPRP